MLSDGQIKHLEELKRLSEERLRVLERKEATQGLNTPAEILLEIDQIRAKISSIDEQLSNIPKDASVPLSLSSTEQASSTTLDTTEVAHTKRSGRTIEELEKSGDELRTAGNMDDARVLYIQALNLAEQQLAKTPPPKTLGNLDPTPKDVDRATLRKILTDNFSEDELKVLFFDLGGDYESLPGSGKVSKVIELVNYFGRHSQIAELIAYAYQARPHANWPSAPRPTQPDQQPSTVRDVPTIARLYRKIGRLYQEQDEADNALQYYKDGLQVLENSTPTREQAIEQALLLNERAVIYIEQVRGKEALEETKAALALMEHWGAVAETGDILRTQAIAYHSLGDRQKFREQMLSARAAYHRVENVQGELQTIGNLAIDTLHWGKAERAIDEFQEMLEMLAGHPDRRMIATVYLNLSVAYADAGKPDQARSSAHRSLEEYQNIDKYGELLAYAALAEALKEQADLAAKVGDQAADTWLDQARQAINSGLGLVDSENIDMEEAASSLCDLYRILSEVYLIAGDYDETRRNLAKIERLREQSELKPQMWAIEPQTWAKSLVVRARLPIQSEGDMQAAYDHLEKARQVFMDTHYRKEVVPVDILRAQTLIDLKRTEEARDILKAVRDLIEQGVRSNEKERVVALLDSLSQR